MTTYANDLFESLQAWIQGRREARAAYEALAHDEGRSRLPRYGAQPLHYRALQQQAAAFRTLLPVSVTTSHASH